MNYELNIYNLECLLHYVLLGPLFWPIWSALICGFFGYKLGNRFVGLFAVICLFFTFFCSVSLFGLIMSKQLIIELYMLPCFEVCFDHTKYIVNWELLYDNLTVSILIVICTISWLVHLYTISYLTNEPHQARFFANLSLFTFFIVFLVTAANYFQFFVGWEGVGICSYLLIGFWFQRKQAVKSALQALVVNKIGDITLIMAIILIFLVNGTTSILVLSEIAPWCNEFEMYYGWISLKFGNFISFLFFIAAIAKSAQIGLHTWLLSAMEGPTPVSALLHAATIVTAGIFLLLRSQCFWQYTDNVSFLIIICGSITAFFAALCGLVQYDIKKVIAFSTCSQLGYILYACGLGEYNVCLYHLTNHAFFKALLFLCAGAVIHTLNGEQDLRRIGGLVKIIPVTYIAMLFASLALLGFPFLSGFFSKDILIELAWCKYSVDGIFTFWLATLSAFITAFYSMRLLYWIFWSNPNFYRIDSLYLNEMDNVILFVFRPLIIGSLFSGYVFRDLFSGLGQNMFDYYWQDVNYILSWDNSTLLPFTYFESEFLPIFVKLLPIVFSLLGIFSSVCIYSSSNVLIKWIKFFLRYRFFLGVYVFFILKAYFDVFYGSFIAKIVFKLSWILYIYGDQGFLEWLGPQGLYYHFSLKTRFLVWITPIYLKLLIVYFVLFSIIIFYF